MLGLITLYKKYKITILKRIKKRYKKNISGEKNDLTIFVTENPPDGSKCRVGERFVKTWTIRNNGNTIWKNRYLKCDTPSKGLEQSETVVKMPVIYPGQEYTLKIVYIPKVQGVYYSYWKAYDENNNLIYPDIEGLGVTIIVEK